MIYLVNRETDQTAYPFVCQTNSEVDIIATLNEVARDWKATEAGQEYDQDFGPLDWGAIDEIPVAFFKAHGITLVEYDQVTVDFYDWVGD